MTLALALIAPVMAQPADPTPPEPVEQVVPVAPSGREAAVRTLMDQRVESKDPVNDLFALAQDVSVLGPVGDNAFLLAQSVDVDAPVAGDIYVMGEKVTIDSAVVGDVYAMGAVVEVTSNASIQGNLRVAAAELVLRGPVAGRVNADVGRLTFGAPVAGDMNVGLGEIEVEDGAALAGDLQYAAPARSPDLESRVAGEVEFTERVVEEEEPVMEVTEDLEEDEGSTLGSVLWWGSMRTWGYLTKLLVGVVLLLLGGERLAAIGRRAASHPGQSLGVGFIAACVVPVVSLGAIVTIAPFPLGVLGLTLFAAALYVSQIFAAQALGDLLLQRFQPGAIGSPYLSLAVGLVPLVALCSLPWLGNLAWLAATFAGLGAMWSVLRGQA